MREIKFRVWDGNMEEPTSINFPEKKVHFDQGIWRSLKDVQLMQYTGLKDKNGVEIYEGDILHEFEEVVDPWRNDNSKDYTQDEKYEVKFLVDHLGSGFKACSRPSEYYDDHDHDTWIKPKTMAVIGNKYENPELLQEVYPFEKES